MRYDRMDGRNPYGSRGGYVSSRRDRAMRRESDMRRDMRMDRYDRMRDRGMRSDYTYDMKRDYPRANSREFYYRDDKESDYQYDYNNSDYYMDRMYDRRYDYAESKYLAKQDLKEWEDMLKHDLDNASREMFDKDKIMRRAEELGIRFNEYTEDEFYDTVLMMYSDYCKTIGSANPDVYVKLAKDFLEDEDAKVRGSEKLAVYHDYIAM